MGSKSGLFGVLFCWVKYVMEYKLYTLVDITHTGQNRSEPGRELARLKEQNFQTVVQTLGIRANIYFTQSPVVTEVQGRLVGFDTDEVLKLWRFDFGTSLKRALNDAGAAYDIIIRMRRYYKDTIGFFKRFDRRDLFGEG